MKGYVVFMGLTNKRFMLKVAEIAAVEVQRDTVTRITLASGSWWDVNMSFTDTLHKIREITGE